MQRLSHLFTNAHTYTLVIETLTTFELQRQNQELEEVKSHQS